MPDDFLDLGTKSVLTIPVLTIIALVVLGVVGYYLHTAPRRPRALRDRLRPRRRRALRPARHAAGSSRAFVLCGALAGLAGVLYAARYGTVSSGAGTGIELQAVGAARHRRRRHLRRQRHRLGRRDRRLPPGHHQPGAADPRHPDFWQRAVVGALIIGAIVLDRVLARPTGTPARGRPRRERTSHEHADPDRPDATRPAPTRRTPGRCGGGCCSPASSRSSRCCSAVFFYSNGNVPNFDGPLTLYYLFLDIAPILLIALPMTLIIITGEIDLSVASVVGLSSVLVGILHQDAGLSIPVAGRRSRSWSARSAAPSTASSSRTSACPSLAVTIGTLALYRGIAVGLLGTKAVTDFPEKWTDLAKERIVEGSQLPDDPDPVPGPAGRVRRCCCTSRPSAAASTRSGSTTRPRTSPASTSSAPSSGCSSWPARSRRSPASTTRCASAAPAATTRPGSSSR